MAAELLYLDGWPFFLTIPCMLLALAALVAGLVALLGTIPRSTRSRAFVVLAYSLSAVVWFVVMFRGQGWARTFAYYRVAQSADPLVNSIHAFAQARGHAPLTLDELVPDFIDRIPTTRAGHGTFEYSVRGDTWSLLLRCGQGALNWDLFYYDPDEDYPAADDQGQPIERIGRWAYLHE